MENTAVANGPGEEAIPKTATAPDGSTFIAWFSNESGNYNVRLQRFDLFGNALWEAGGLLVSDHPSMTWLTDWDMTVDPEGHAILAFQDIRNGDNDVFAYRVSPSGEMVWGEDGLELSNGPAFDAAPKVCVTPSGNSVIAWQADDVSIMQKISPEGDLLWGDSGIVISEDNASISWPQLIAAGEDEVYLKYFKDTGPVWAPTRHVYAQRFDGEGVHYWNDPAVISNAGGISAWNQVFSLIADGGNGFFIAWHDDRDGDMHSSAFVQHINEDGEFLLGDDGTELSTQSGRHNFYPMLALPADSDNLFVFWNEMDSDQNLRGIYGQKLSPSGERLWTDQGKPFIEISGTNVYPIEARTDGEDLLVFYEEYIDAVDGKLMALKVDKEGTFVWPGQSVEVCAVESEKVHSVAGMYHSDQWIVVWEDNRNGNKDIYAQNLQVDGTLGALPDQPSIFITPDTLFVEENNMDYTIHIVNDSYSEYTIENIMYESDYLFIENMPDFPYSLAPNDSLHLFLPVYYVGSGGMGMGYVYDTLFVESAWDTISSITAFNLDVIPGIGAPDKARIQVYPNPGNQFVLKLPVDLQSGSLSILNTSGQVIRVWQFLSDESIGWDGKTSDGSPCPAGVYYYIFQSGENMTSGKIVLSR